MILNGKEIKIKEFTFNTMIDLEDHGVSLNTLAEAPLKFVRAVIALNLGITSEAAGMEINNHMMNGGGLEELVESISDSIVKSGFMKALQNQAEVQAK